MKRSWLYLLAVTITLIPVSMLMADDTILRRGSSNSADITVDTAQFQSPAPKKSSEGTTSYGQFDPMKYTLGPNDVVEIEVLRHPEFGGKFLINQEGKLQLKFVGDLEVKGMTKVQLEDKLKESLAQYVVSPEINVTIVEYGSKVFYVMGEVATPGQFIMKSEGIALRDAIHLAGLPTSNAALRKCRIITPAVNGKAKVRSADLYALLYCGDLRKDITVMPGDILYVPSTVVAKAIRVISPVTTVVGISASPVESSATARTAVQSLKKHTAFGQ